MGFAVDLNTSNNQTKNYMKNMIPGAHLSNSLYSDIPGKVFLYVFKYFIINYYEGTNFNNLLNLSI